MTQSMYSLTHGAQAAPLAVACGQATHRGRQRHENQDCAACFEIPVENAGLLLDWQRTTVAIVADGMGGAPGGARASALAVAAFQFALLRRTDQPITDRLESALQFAHRALAETAVHEPHLEGMRTTLVAAAVTGNQLYLIHAGDSRAYLVRNGSAYQLTVDHSWVQDAQDNNELSAADAGRHPRRSEINRCLGGSAPISGDHAIVAPLRAGLPGYAERSFVESLTLKVGDSVLLCSDGLHGVAALPTMATLVTSLPAQAAADQLVALANASGGPDNIAAVVMAVEPQVLQSPSGEQPVHDGWTLRAIQASLATIVVALLGVSAYAIPNLVEGGRLPGSTPIPQPSAIVTMPATIGAPGVAGPPSEATRLAPQRSVSQAVPASAPLIPPTATLYPTPTSTLTPTITPTITPPPTLAPTLTPGAAAGATDAATKADLTLPTATPPAQQSSPLATPAASID